MSVLEDLVALKQQCFDSCGDADTAEAAIDPNERARAVVAFHVQQHGPDSLKAALAAGPLRFLDDKHVEEVARVADAGGDPVKAAGADPKHVALLRAAQDAHAAHKDELEAAYARLAAE